MPKLLSSVQLYTLRNETAKDFAGTMRQIAQIGYAGVELAGYGNLSSAADVRKAIDTAGLRISGMHVAIEQLEGDFATVVADQRVLGNTQVIIPFLSPERRKNAADWRAFAQAADQFGAKLKREGITLSYHHHDFEFKPLDLEKSGKTNGFDIIWQTASPENLKAELDVFWLALGGRDPVKTIDSLGRRVSAVHLKDQSRDEASRFAEVGTGRLEFSDIAAAMHRADVKWGIVEQDECYGRAPLDCIRTSFENLKKLSIF